MTDATKKWLEEIGLGRYAAVFAEHDIERDVVPDLTDQDLKDLGMSLGHRKRLLRAVHAAAGERALESSSRTEKAERRQITVMFCDLVGSTGLSTRFDPEELHGIIREFQVCCERVINRFDGNVARYMGDGLLVYFGYPIASEHDPENAVRAARDVIGAVAQLSPTPGLKLQTRIGIATGAVVVGDLVGHGAAQEQPVIGETPNLANRLQELAAPDSVVISEVTRRLVGDLFEYVDLGLHPVKGFDVPVPAWRVGDELVVESRFEAFHSRARLSKLVGREREIESLMQLWGHATRYEGRAAVLIGEAGIGKSRLTVDLQEQLAQIPHRLLRYSCVRHYQDSSLFPIITYLERLAGFAGNDPPDVKLDKLEALLSNHFQDVAARAPLYAALLAIPTEARYPPLNLGPRLQKERTFTALMEQFVALAAERPVLLVFEDLHWVDPTTLELIDWIVKRIGNLPIFMLMTARPSFQVPWTRDECGAIRLDRLSDREATSLIADVTSGKSLPRELVVQLLDKADGIPLFVEELTKTMMESSHLIERDGRFEFQGAMPDLIVPNTLRDSLTSRLDRLGVAKDIAQIGAVIGRQFSYELLSAVVPHEAAELRNALHRLVDSELVSRIGIPPHSTYTFRHALIQDAAYSSLLLSERPGLHRRIAEALDERAETLEPRPELIAYHYTKASEHRKAIARWQEAGRQARDRAAHAEAVQHLKTALELIKHLPDDAERGQLELQLHVDLGINLEAVGGYGDIKVAENYARARALCEQLGYTTERVPVLLGQYVFHLARAHHRTARELAEQCMELSEQAGRVDYLLDSCNALGHVLPYLGELRPSLPILRRCVTLSRAHRKESYTPITAQDPEVASLGQLCTVLWLLGYPDQAVEHIEEAFELANVLGQPINVVLICVYAAEIHQMRGETAKAMEYARTGTRVSAEHGYDYWHLVNTMHLGIATGAAGQFVEGAALWNPALEGLRAAGAECNLAYFLSAPAELTARAGDVDRAFQLITDAFEMAERTNEYLFLSHLHQVRGELKLASPEPDYSGAEADFLEAAEVARAQFARSLELRAAMKLHRLYRAQGRAHESHRMLSETYASFTEGFGTADLQAAKALLTSDACIPGGSMPGNPVLNRTGPPMS